MAKENLLSKVIADFVVLSAVSLSIMILRLFVVPPTRGFFCSDESIRYPFKDSTVPTVALFVVGFGLPIGVMVITEPLLAKTDRAVSLHGVRIPLGVVKCYGTIGAFVFGAACTQVITDVGKYSIGRLRPHFTDVCDPDVDCSLDTNQGRYITNYTCRGPPSEKLREIRLSFPSGHSSFAAYSMLYLALYTQDRVNWKGSHLLKPAAQLCCALMCMITALSRVNDNKHHWSDVTVGLLLGTAVAILTVIFVSDLFSKHEIPPSTEDETREEEGPSL